MFALRTSQVRGKRARAAIDGQLVAPTLEMFGDYENIGQHRHGYHTTLDPVSNERSGSDATIQGHEIVQFASHGSGLWEDVTKISLCIFGVIKSYLYL